MLEDMTMEHALSGKALPHLDRGSVLRRDQDGVDPGEIRRRPHDRSNGARDDLELRTVDVERMRHASMVSDLPRLDTPDDAGQINPIDIKAVAVDEESSLRAAFTAEVPNLAQLHDLFCGGRTEVEDWSQLGGDVDGCRWRFVACSDGE